MGFPLYFIEYSRGMEFFLEMGIDMDGYSLNMNGKIGKCMSRKQSKRKWRT